MSSWMTRSKRSSSFSSRMSAWITSTMSVSPFRCIVMRVCSTMSENSTATTRFAPARAATPAQTPVPLPTSSTVIPGFTARAIAAA